MQECVINLPNVAGWATRSDSPICTWSRASSTSPRDAYVTTTSSTLSITPTNGASWATGSVVAVQCATTTIVDG